MGWRYIGRTSTVFSSTKLVAFVLGISLYFRSAMVCDQQRMTELWRACNFRQFRGACNFWQLWWSSFFLRWETIFTRVGRNVSPWWYPILFICKTIFTSLILLLIYFLSHNCWDGIQITTWPFLLKDCFGYRTILRDYFF